MHLLIHEKKTNASARSGFDPADYCQQPDPAGRLDLAWCAADVTAGCRFIRLLYGLPEVY